MTLVTFSFPGLTFGQIADTANSIEPQPPRTSAVQVNTANVNVDINDTNSSTKLIEGGRQAITECLETPLGAFDSIVSSQLTAMSIDFLGGAGLVDKFGNIAATANNLISTATNIFSAADSLAGLIPGVDLGAPELTNDSLTRSAVTGSLNTLQKLGAKAGAINARGQADLNQLQREMQVSNNCIDQAVYIEGQQMLYQLKDDAVEWIQSGFEGGNPGFVQNIDQRNRDIASAQWLRFLDPDNEEFQNVCEVFREDVVKNVRAAYYQTFNDQSQILPELDLSITEERLLQEAVTTNTNSSSGCALDEATGSSQATGDFIGGNFSAGGWDAWLTLFNDPNSNPTNASLSLTNELLTDINQAQENDATELDRSGGFLSDRVCENGNSVGFGGTCADGSIPQVITPGSTVATIMQELIVSDIRRLELADEIGEIVENIGRTLVGSIFPTGNQSSTAGLAGLSRVSFSEAYTEASERDFLGANPEGFTIAQLERQTTVENNMYDVFGSIWELRNSDGIQDAGQCVDGSSRDLQSNLQEFDAIVNSIIPGSQNSIESRDTYEVPGGEYRVDWAGNDLEWEYEKVYGLQDCRLEQYGNVAPGESDRSNLLENFLDEPEFSFRVPRDSDTWKISICAPRDDGATAVFVPLNYEPPAFRAAENRRKVDWNNIAFDWKFYDPFTKSNGYGIDQCNTSTAGETAYSVGYSLAGDNQNRPTAADESGLSTDSFIGNSGTRRGG